MKCEWIPCGPIANESERRAFEQIRRCCESAAGEGRVFLLTNVLHSVNTRMQADEIDAVVIGPSGVRVIEVKHWTAAWIKEHEEEIIVEANRLLQKTKKVATSLRKVVADLSFVRCHFLLTPAPSRIGTLPQSQVQGVSFDNLNSVDKVIGICEPAVLSPPQVELLARSLSPRNFAIATGDLRRLAGYVNLERQLPKEGGFRRVYRATHPTRQDRVILHLYDLSADPKADRKAEERARREFDSLQKLQIYRWAPRILDSFQSVPGYCGEMYFFTLIDPAAPTIADRIPDRSWNPRSRVEFACRALEALRELHEAGGKELTILHRNLTPQTILVTSDNQPLFTGFQWAHLPDHVSIGSTALIQEFAPQFLAPEVRANGLAAADRRSDLFSLCASLVEILQELPGVEEPREILEDALKENPKERPTIEEIVVRLRTWLGDSVPPLVAPSAKFWSEGQEIPFGKRHYRIVSKLGSGGMGTTFKVVEIRPGDQSELGVFVAKVAHNQEAGERIRRGYEMVRSHVARHVVLSAVFEVAPEWKDNEFVALLSWIEGTPLAEFIGVFPLLSQELDEAVPEDLALRWVRDVCDGLRILHQNDLVHGDVSPRNLIVSGSSLVLTDYDFVTKVGANYSAPGTVLYCAPSAECREKSSPADDFFALAATFYHVVFDQEPFFVGGIRDKSKGLCWEGLPRDDYPRLVRVLERATHPDPSQRFSSANEALAFLDRLDSSAKTVDTVTSRVETDRGSSQSVVPPGTSRSEKPQSNDWLRELLRSYPGSRWGNTETRGLDSEFAERTYVPTNLEETLWDDILKRRVRLVILCGNAGDGKTALLQHLAQRFGLKQRHSSARVLKGSHNGLRILINLDGSAAWQDRSSNDLLDELFEPFQNGSSPKDLVHLVAVNDGRLLEWIESVEERRGTTPLTKSLRAHLEGNGADRGDSYLRFLSLRDRSLVGGLSPEDGTIETQFLDRLVDQLYGGAKAEAIWSPCLSCASRNRCEVFRAARVFGPEGVPERISEQQHRHARRRLYDMLKAVHMRGETHITMRELRAALVYVLFGVDYCEDYHKKPLESFFPYWDRAFSPRSPNRQGPVLMELLRFDPALDAHPHIDRYLTEQPFFEEEKTIPHYPDLSLASARRRAYFEWLPEWIEQVGGTTSALDLLGGAALRAFSELPLMKEEDRDRACQIICRGIARLEYLPELAYARKDVVPLRVPPRTPTETIFWVEKDIGRFRLEADLPPTQPGLERLHRAVWLIYRYRDGREERLRLGLDLFARLWELSEGYQLGDVASDEIFTQLSIFVQRLLREEQRSLLAYHPSAEDHVLQISIERTEALGGGKQRLILKPVNEQSIRVGSVFNLSRDGEE